MLEIVAEIGAAIVTEIVAEIGAEIVTEIVAEIVAEIVVTTAPSCAEIVAEFALVHPPE